jgi:hypothetical protein
MLGRVLTHPAQAWYSLLNTREGNRMSSKTSIDTLYTREAGICWLCHRFVEREQASRDHIIPKSFGGPNHMSNYALAHIECNNQRGNDKSLPSMRLVVTILRNVQGHVCGKCGIKATKLDRIMSHDGNLKVVCLTCDFFRVIPRQRNPKAMKISRKGYAMEMTVLDTIFAFQMEEGDFVGFNCGPSNRTGIVQSIDDNGDTLIVHLLDDKEGDIQEYKIDANLNISLLGQEEMAI